MTDSERAGERAKYDAAYQRPGYKMGPERLANSRAAVRDWADGRGYRHYLDVGAGRGEMLDYAESCDFQQIGGTEIVRALIEADPRLTYAEAHALPFPDRSADVVTCFDVLEHLLPADVIPAVDHLFRVARAVVIVSAAADSQFQEGVEHHPSRRPLAKWRSLLVARAKPAGFRLRETRFCRKGSDLWVFTGKKAKGRQ
jgi:SAM-dependent methyltransferase